VGQVCIQPFVALGERLTVRSPLPPELEAFRQANIAEDGKE